jgi:small GTP-binding protein
MSSKFYEYIIIGPPSVGKTSIMLRYTENIFITKSYNTLGIDLKHKIVNSPFGSAEIAIWDTAGQERYSPITNSFLRYGNCILLCFSIASKQSFDECKKYVQIIKNNAKPNAIVYLVGTFLDMKEHCLSINFDEIKEFAKENNYKYFEVSSKTGEGIKQLFDSSMFVMDELNLNQKRIYQTLQEYVPKSTWCCNR